MKDIYKDIGFNMTMLQPDVTKEYISANIAPKIINSLNSLFIYSDIVEHQFVGDSYTPLLRVVSIPNKTIFGEYVNEIYNSPHYVPVSRSVLNTIEIDIKTDTGEAVPFSAGKLLVKLHFRPLR